MLIPTLRDQKLGFELGGRYIVNVNNERVSWR